MSPEPPRTPHRHTTAVSPWVARWAHLIAPHGTVLDLACGGGRHARYLAGLGHAVLAVDRDAAALAQLAGVGGITVLEADLEGAPWPLGERRFGAVVVTNYLHRPLMPRIVGSLAEGGVLLYETFAAGNERFGKPSNPDFLLRPGELLEAVRGHLRVTAYEDLQVDAPAPAMVQRICAQRLPAA
jgi:SAM-dependent methyltransferase